MTELLQRNKELVAGCDGCERRLGGCALDSYLNLTSEKIIIINQSEEGIEHYNQAITAKETTIASCQKFKGKLHVRDE